MVNLISKSINNQHLFDDYVIKIILLIYLLLFKGSIKAPSLSLYYLHKMLFF